MNLTDIYKVPTKRKKKWRVGRGESSGSGKMSGRGHKGQKARTGVSFRPYFQGGQMPIIRRIPKRGFNNPFKKTYVLVNVSQLEDHFQSNDVIDIEKLKSVGLVKKEMNGIKILGNGALTKKLIVKAHKFSKSAVEKISKAGGTAELVNADKPKI